MKFWKMNGAGNDFIILDGIQESIRETELPLLARTLCERHLSVGADGLMYVKPSEGAEADYAMLFYNSDGSLGEMCGNGARCICRYGYETGLAGDVQKVMTTAGLVTGKRIDQRNYRIRLNDPTVCRLDIPVSTGNENLMVSYVELGCPGLPHAVLELPERFHETVRSLLSGRELSEEERSSLSELRELGRKLRYHEAFPKGANVNFLFAADPSGKPGFDIITFERGVEDFTYACGTGTGSSALVLFKKGKTGRHGIPIRNRGGMLTVDVEENDLFLTGPTNIVCKGEVTDETFEEAGLL